MLYAKFHNAGCILKLFFVKMANVALLLPKHGSHMGLQISSSHPAAHFPRNGQSMALFWHVYAKFHIAGCIL